MAYNNGRLRLQDRASRNDAKVRGAGKQGTLAGAMLYCVIIAVAPPTAGSPIRMRHPAAAYYVSPSRTKAQSAGAYGNSFV